MGTYLVVYVDNLVMSGPEINMKQAWKEITQVLGIEKPEPTGFYLGCLHREYKVIVDGHERGVMEPNQERFSKDKITNYIASHQLRKQLGNH